MDLLGFGQCEAVKRSQTHIMDPTFLEELVNFFGLEGPSMQHLVESPDDACLRIKVSDFGWEVVVICCVLLPFCALHGVH